MQLINIDNLAQFKSKIIQLPTNVMEIIGDSSSWNETFLLGRDEVP